MKKHMKKALSLFLAIILTAGLLVIPAAARCSWTCLYTYYLNNVKIGTANGGGSDSFVTSPYPGSDVDYGASLAPSQVQGLSYTYQYNVVSQTGKPDPIWGGEYTWYVEVNYYYKDPSHTLTYNIAGAYFAGTYLSTKANENTTVTAVSPTAHVGYTFSGWTSSDVTVTNNSFIMPTKNVTLTGSYLRNTYPVQYKYTNNPANAPALPVNATAYYGDTVTVQSTPALAGYNFSGWTSSNASISSGRFTMPANAVTLSGSWTPRTDTQYNVKFYVQNPDDDSYVEQIADTISGQGTTDTQIRAALDMTALNSKYPHCHLSDSSKADVTTIGGAGTSVLNLYYDRDTANVSYVYSGIIPSKAPTLPASTARRFNSTVPVATAPTLAGYDFSDWETSNITVSEGTFSMPSTDVTFSGSWTPHTNTPYTVEYYQQNIDDDNYTLADTEHCTGTTDTKVVVPDKTYPGFTMSPDSITASTTTNIDGEGNTVLKLYYDRNVNTVSYAYSGDTDSTPALLPAAKSYRYGQTVALAMAPSLTGYDFEGWNTTDAAVAGGTFTMPDSTVTLTGTWVPRSDTAFVVEYYQQNLADPDYTKVAADTYAGVGTTGTAIPQAHKEYEGFTETGPSVAAETATKIASNGSTVLKLYYDRNSYAATYSYTSDHIDGEPACPAEQLYQYGASVTVEPAFSELTGYHFDGWNSDDVSLSSGAFTMPAKAVSITGAWLPNTDTPYKAEFYQQNLESDEYSLSDTVNGHGTTGTAIPEAAKPFPGFTMTAASTAEAGTTVIAPDGSTVLKLYYDRNHHSVTYTYAGDIPTTPQPLPAKADYVFGQAVTLAAAPKEVSGTKFLGWKSLDVDTTSGPFNMPDKDVTITGTWQLSGGGEDYTVTLIADDSAKTIINFIPGEQVMLPEGPAKNDYTFVGWAEFSGGEVKQRAGDTVRLTKSTIFYAVYAKQTGAFIYGYRDGTFRPEDNLTTYQSQLMLARLMDTPEPDAATNSKKAISRKEFLSVVEQSTATARINNDVTLTATKMGWIQGQTDGSVQEDAYITRAQAVIILNRAFNRSDVQPDNAISYTDLPKNYWAHDQIIAASTKTTK